MPSPVDSARPNFTARTAGGIDEIFSAVRIEVCVERVEIWAREGGKTDCLGEGDWDRKHQAGKDQNKPGGVTKHRELLTHEAVHGEGSMLASNLGTILHHCSADELSV